MPWVSRHFSQASGRIGGKPALLLVCGFLLGTALPSVSGGLHAIVPAELTRNTSTPQDPTPVHMRAPPPCSPSQRATDGVAVLQATVAGIVQAAHAHGVLRAAVHVVDLESCERFTVAPEERFEPGSLFKVPVAVAWVRLSGTSKLGMDRQLLSDHPAPVVEFANPEPEVLKQGQSYPVHFLLEHMLVDSSNDALAVLGPHVPPTVFAEIWAELGIGPMPVGKTPEVRVGDVAAMFQALYDGTWLNRAGSELVLSWLLRSTWRNGLVSKLPTSAEVAHKFGIRYLHDPAHPETLAANAPALHLSECGILYQAKRPMLVCIMTEATSDAAAEGLIGDVGKAVWDWAATLARG